MAVSNLHTDTSEKISSNGLQSLLENLTGEHLPISDSCDLLAQVADRLSEGQSIGHSQFNELLMYLGYDRVAPEFFQFICSPEALGNDFRHPKQISSVATLVDGVSRFRKLALLLYGNIKFAFKTLSQDPERLLYFSQEVHAEKPDGTLRTRHDPLVELKRIDGSETYLLGYISGMEIDKQLAKNPTDQGLLQKKAHRDSTIEKGKWNHNVYLTSDHLDVYVATSMRERHEYLFVNEFMTRIESNPHIKDLKLRFFDPTQAYCPDRIDKGLAEALMLKRAACTIYLAQESDTLGKDSELASTLAQGKPVIAFLPEVDKESWDYLFNTFRTINSNETEEETLLRILKIYSPNAAWEDASVVGHLSRNKSLTVKELKEKAQEAVKAHYDKRANVLKNAHPLGLQTNLGTGVANGVLVARRIEECALLVKKILLSSLEFDIEDGEGGYVFLREKITGCIFRVMTGDKLLTNSFWNFYIVD